MTADEAPQQPRLLARIFRKSSTVEKSASSNLSLDMLSTESTAEKELSAGEIKTPRSRIDALRKDATIQEAADLFATVRHSHLPIFDEDLDEICAVLSQNQLLGAMANKEESGILELASPPYFVPEGHPIDILLAEMKARKVELAIVIDEHGGTAGLVTQRDILDELAEATNADDLCEGLHPLPQGGYLAEGACDIDDLTDVLQMELPEEAPFDTLGGFIFFLANEIPARGAEFSYGNWRFKVHEADERRVLQVLIHPLAQNE